MAPRLLAWVLAQAFGMGILHLVLGRRSPFPHVAFCALSGAAATLFAMVALGGPLAEHARLSAWTAAWIPGFSLGAYVVGVVLGAAWLGVVQGGGWWLRRRLAR